MKDLFSRGVRAALFDRKVYGDWLFDRSATGDAAILVIGVAAVRTIAELIRFRSVNVLGLVSAVIFALAGWIFLSLATWFVGTRLFQGSGDIQTTMRLQGLGYLPTVLGVLGPIPAAIGDVWYLAAAAVGTSVALSQKMREAVLSVLVGAAVLFLVGLLVGATFAGVGGLFGLARGLGSPAVGLP